MFKADPFSKAEIAYVPIASALPIVSSMLKSHFPGYQAVSVFQLDRKEINSANYQIVIESPTREQKTVLLREFRTLTDATQIDFYLGFISQLYARGVRVSKIIKTVDGASTAQAGDAQYTVFDFIDARYFTPTEDALIAIAKEVARMHVAFAEVEATHIERIKSMSRQGSTFFNAVPSVLVSDVMQIKKILEAKRKRTDLEVLIYDTMPTYLQTASEIEEMRKRTEKYPAQIFHSDLHPHNILLEKKSDGVAAIVDFDSMRVAHLGHALDVAYAIYRLGKQFFVGVTMDDTDIKKHAHALREEFITHYSTIKTLHTDEVRLLPILCKEEMMKKLIYLLRGTYLGNNTLWLHELPKFISAIDEINYFWD